MSFIDPSSLSDNLQEALVVQSGLPLETALKCARVFESLRFEAIQENALEEYHRVVQVDPAAGDAMQATLDEIVSSLLTFLADWSPGIGDLEGYRAFEATFRAFAAAEIGVKSMFGLVRALEVSDLGTMRIDPKRFRTSVVDGLIQVDDSMSVAERLVVRTSWIVSHIRDAEVQGLSPGELAQVEYVAGLADDQLTEDLVMALEYLLLKSLPNYKLFATKEGLAQLSEQYRGKAHDALVKLQQAGGLHADDQEFLDEYGSRASEDITDAMNARVLKIAALTFAPVAPSEPSRAALRSV